MLHYSRRSIISETIICRLFVRVGISAAVRFEGSFCFNQEQEIFWNQLSSPTRLKWLTIGILLESQRRPRQRLAVHLILLKEWQSAAARSESRGASRRLPGTLRGPEKDLENTLKRAYGGIWEGPKRLGVRNQSAWGETSSFGLSVSIWVVMKMQPGGGLTWDRDMFRTLFQPNGTKQPNARSSNNCH